MKLRPYQSIAMDCTMRAFEDHASALVVMPTGSGKTVYFSHLCKEILPLGRCMILAHREELIMQSAAKIRAITGMDPDIEMAERYANESGHFRGPSPIVVSSVQTQNSGKKRKRMQRFAPSEFALLIIDEAHHAPARTYKAVVDWFRQNPNLRVLGVTATPDRADKSALGQIFECCPFVYEIEDAIQDGWLVPVRQQYIVCRDLDFSEIHTVAGDLNQAELASVVEDEHALHEMVTPTIEIVGDKKTLFFATSVLQAERVAEIFNRHRPGMARCVFGKTPTDERREIFNDYKHKKFQVLVNVGVATEGFDDPTIDVVAVGRPTKSRALYAQMIGRATRPIPGIVDDVNCCDKRRSAIASSEKPFAIVLDFVGNSGKHKLVSAADILGGNFEEEDIEAAKEIMQRSSRPANIEEAIENARQQRLMRCIIEAQAREKIRAKAAYAVREINPFSGREIAPEYKSSGRWYHKLRPATEKQLAILRKRGYKTDDLTIAEASKIIDGIAFREGWKKKT